MKKITLMMMITSATILMAAPAAETAPAQAGGPAMMGQQQGKGMMSQGKCGQGKCGQGMQRMQGKKMGMQGKNMRKKMMKHMKKTHSPFLIKQGLPHMSKLVMLSWNDQAFGLTEEQKTTLEGIRKKTMGSIANLKKEILPLTKSILTGTYSGKTADELKEDVKKLGQLEAEATIIQIQCIEETKKVLSKDQLIYLLQKSAQHKKMRRMK